MKVPLDVRCLECARIFCCAGCRRTHESAAHGLSYECPLCRGRPWPRDDLNTDLMEHVKKCHLPLACNRCGHCFQTKEDFNEDSLRCCSKVTTTSPPENSTENPATHSVEYLTKHLPKNLVEHSVEQSVEQSVEHLREDTSHSLASKHKRRRRASSEPAQRSSDSAILDSVRIKDGRKFLNHANKSAVMTSTPTHPRTPPWGLFHKSFTSTLSGIGSPDSDNALQSPPAQDEQKVTSSNQISSIHCTPPDDHHTTQNSLKSIMSKSSSKSGQTPEGSHSLETSHTKRKKVTFMVNAEPKKNIAFEFLRPNRAPTPGKQRRRTSKRTTRIQAMINNYESKTIKPELSTPVQARPTGPTSPEETPHIIDETNGVGITARAINFKKTDSPEISSENSSPAESYKSCRDETPKSSFDSFPHQIAKSIQETLSTALNAVDERSTEIHLNIVITNKLVSLKEIKKERDKPLKEFEVPVQESTTVWTRLVNGLKWVMWGDKQETTPKRDDFPFGDNLSPEWATSIGSGKRKRLLSHLGGSPVNNKRHRLQSRIKGRRPLHDALCGKFGLLERTQSDLADFNIKEEDAVKKESKIGLNKSF